MDKKPDIAMGQSIWALIAGICIGIYFSSVLLAVASLAFTMAISPIAFRIEERQRNG